MLEQRSFHLIKVLVLGLIFGILSFLMLDTITWAKPIDPNQQIPVDFRRTTLVVRDIDHALPLYRDTLGLKVIYDHVVDQNIRLVLLQANDDFIGVLGLMQRLNEQEKISEPVFRKAQAGDPILVFNVKDLDHRFEKVKKTPHVRIFEEPHLMKYPTADGKGMISVMMSAVWDADGNFVELNQIINHH